MEKEPKTPTVTATISKWQDHPRNANWLMVGPFSAEFIQEANGNTIFADEYESTVNGETREKGNWHFCDADGDTIQITSEEEFYIKAKKSWVGSGNITFQLKTRRLRVRAEWWDIISATGNQAQILMASAIRDFVYANATSVVIPPPYVIINKEDQDTHEKLQGVQFYVRKASDNTKYITGFDSSGYPTYGAKENAKTFTTDALGNTERFKVELINYQAEEISVGSNTGYASGKVFNINVRKGENTIVLGNKKEYIPVSGYVWEDLLGVGGKRPEECNWRYKEGKNDINDKLVQGVKVELVNTKTGEIKEQYTDKDGKYKFLTLKIDDIANYYIRFSYNGMCYENVPILDVQADNKSKAAEGTARETFNQFYSTIEGDTEDTGVALNEKGEESYKLNYKTTDVSSEILYRSDKDESKYNFGYEENKDSKCPVSGVDDQYMIMATTQNVYKDEKDPAKNPGNLNNIYTAETIRKDGIKEIENVNLGIRKRAKPDIALGKDLHNVKVAINGYGQTYFYKNRYKSDYLEKEGEGFNVGVKFKNMYTGTYTREIYHSDYNYKYQGEDETEKEKRELQVWVTYELKMVQGNDQIKAKINSIMDYYDPNYELVKVGSKVDPESGEITDDIKTTNKKSTSQYKKVLIENNTELEPNKERSIYIQFYMNRKKIEEVLSQNEDKTFENMAEINSYSIFDKETGKVSAGIDKDSNPGNAEKRRRRR